MKKITILVASALIVGLGFTSCSSDDDSNDNNSIVAKWNYNRVKTSVNGIVISDEPYDDDEPTCERDYLDIRANNTAEFGDYYLNPDCVLETYLSAYAKNGNLITVTQDGDSETAEILSINSNTMVLRFEETYEGMTATNDVSFTKAN